jgi:hypothetical protein
MACVLGDRVRDALFPRAKEGTLISIGSDASVDPWWMPDATDYPLEGKDETLAPRRGPVEARVVGIMEPDQGPELDHGIFVPVHPLLRELGQYDRAGNTFYYPQAVVRVEDGSRVDARALEADIVSQLPGVEGTDDAWDRQGFREAYESTASALDGWLLAITAVLVVMLVAGVSDTTLVAVSDRRREIATLRAVGLRRRQVSSLVLQEVLLLSALGLVLGLLAGSGLSLLFGHLHEVTGGEGVFLAPVSLRLTVLGGAALLALGTAALAAAYPAHRAAGQDPTEALRHE